MKTQHSKDSQMEHLEWLANTLDSKFRTPFGLRIGWDGVIGLIPGVGDLITTIASSYIIVQGAAMGVPASVMTRMILNVVFDEIISAVPLIGWAGDFFWKSNVKNIELMKRHLVNPSQLHHRSRVYVGTVILIMLVLSLGALFLAGFLAVKLFGYLFNATQLN